MAQPQHPFELQINESTSPRNVAHSGVTSESNGSNNLILNPASRNMCRFRAHDCTTRRPEPGRTENKLLDSCPDAPKAFAHFSHGQANLLNGAEHLARSYPVGSLSLVEAESCCKFEAKASSSPGCSAVLFDANARQAAEGIGKQLAGGQCNPENTRVMNNPKLVKHLPPQQTFGGIWKPQCKTRTRRPKERARRGMLAFLTGELRPKSPLGSSSCSRCCRCASLATPVPAKGCNKMRRPRVQIRTILSLYGVGIGCGLQVWTWSQGLRAFITHLLL